MFLALFLHVFEQYLDCVTPAPDFKGVYSIPHPEQFFGRLIAFDNRSIIGTIYTFLFLSHIKGAIAQRSRAISLCFATDQTQ